MVCIASLAAAVHTFMALRVETSAYCNLRGDGSKRSWAQPKAGGAQPSGAQGAALQALLQQHRLQRVGNLNLQAGEGEAVGRVR